MAKRRKRTVYVGQTGQNTTRTRRGPSVGAALAVFAGVFILSAAMKGR